MKTIKDYIVQEKLVLKKNLKQDENEMEFIDLGLPSGTLWGSCNLGSKTPIESGNFYAWGETEPKDEYNWDTYKFGDKSTLNKYTEDDGLDTLEPADDAAYIELGREYRVPSYDQVYELMRNTKSKHFMTDNGVNCIELKSIRNDKSIIFPMSGFYSKTDAINPKKLCSKNFETLIWVSCLSNGVDLHATALNIDFHKNEQFITFKNRCNGFQIRPVTMTK
jgi:hypothetical protein